MANERARQKKLERKRRKREERRRALRLETGEWVPQPMSVTLKHFAEPLLDRLPDDADADDWKVVLNFAAMVWNAAEDGLSDKVLSLGRDLFETMGWEDNVAETLSDLRARRAAQFGWEPRSVAAVEVERRDDTMHILTASALV